MTKLRDFVAALARAGKSYPEILKTTEAAFGGKSLSKSTIYNIINKFKAGESTEDRQHLNPKKTKRTEDIIAAVAADVKADRRITCRDLASVSFETMHNILHVELGLVKKSARWVPKLLSPEQKEERVRICTEFVAAIDRSSMTMLDQIITINEILPLGQCARPHRRQCQELAGRQGHPATAPPPCSPDLAPADFFLFRKVKEELDGLHLSQESFKSAWEGVTRTISEDEFTTAFRRWYERSEKCVRNESRLFFISPRIKIMCKCNIK
jgi:hypothetical protein